MIRSSKENNSSSHSKKKAAIAALLLFLVTVVMIFIKEYQPVSPNLPQHTLSSVQSTTTHAKSLETPEITYNVEPAEIREHQLKEDDRQFLIERGLKDPINGLVQDLMKHNEIIPCEGAVGGKPGFNDPNRIAVLSKDHVIADYDDGHVEGTIELTFMISNGTISWKVVNAECDD
jgi:hypothetical protein